MKNMKRTTNNTVGLGITIFFAIIFVVSFIVFPETGEKILYGKHPPEGRTEQLTYSQIIKSENYKCLETASYKAQGDLSKFVNEFNDCNK